MQERSRVPASDATAGALALIVGAVAVVSVTTLAVFFAVGGPFGTINDWTVGLLGLLSGLLAWVLDRRWIGHGVRYRDAPARSTDELP